MAFARWLDSTDQAADRVGVTAGCNVDNDYPQSDWLSERANTADTVLGRTIAMGTDLVVRPGTCARYGHDVWCLSRHDPRCDIRWQRLARVTERFLVWRRALSRKRRRSDPDIVLLGL